MNAPAAGTLDTFDAAWDVCAERGECDERGGLEYARCRLMWDRRGHMLAALAFILTEANQPPATGATDGTNSKG